MASKSSDTKRRCIYCDRQGLTKEHVWGKWSRPHQLRQWRFSRHVLQTYPNGDLFAKPEVSRGHGDRPGAVRSQSLKIVCEACNNGWLSLIAKDAAPVLTKLNYGGWPTLDHKAQEALSNWLGMFTINTEYFDQRTAMISEDARKRFFNELSLDGEWFVAVGSFSEIPPSDQYFHRAFKGKDEPISAKVNFVRFGMMFAAVIWRQNGFDNYLSSQLRRLPLRVIHPKVWREVPRPLLWHTEYSEEMIINSVSAYLNGYELIPIPLQTSI